jgi:hypothetical protein
MKKHAMGAACAVFLCLMLAACQTNMSGIPHTLEGASDLTTSHKEVKFFDIKKFDHELYQALQSKEPEVTVVLYEKVSPNNTPDRLQKWLNSVERNGGKIDIEPPPNELVPRNPFALIGLIGSLWDVIKAATDFRDSQLTQSVKGRDAVIRLERNTRGEIVLNSITFKKQS